MTNKELAEYLKNSKMTPTTLSILNPTKQLRQVVVDMVNHVIEGRVHKPPYIAWVSKMQLLWGNGFHFKDSLDQDVKCGLSRHAFTIRPKNTFRKALLDKYRQTLDWPPRSLLDIIQGTIRKDFIARTADGGDIDHRYFFGRGYIDSETGGFIEDYSRAICGYFIMMRNPEYRDEQREYLLQSPLWLRLQYLRVQGTYRTTVISQIESAKKKMFINQMLYDFNEIDEIDLDLPENLIPWDDC